MLESVATPTQIGKLGCQHCIFWKEYGAINLELNGLVGKWGRCNNDKTTAELNKKSLERNTSVDDRTKTVLNRLSIDMIVLSTCPTYLCPNMRIPKDTKENKKIILSYQSLS